MLILVKKTYLVRKGTFSQKILAKSTSVSPRLFLDLQGKTWLRALRVRCPACASRLTSSSTRAHTKERSRRKPQTAPHTQRETTIPRGRRAEGAPPHRYGCGAPKARLTLCVVRCVVFYVSVLLCGARVLDDVRREAQAGQRTRKARSQVLPCKSKCWAHACWLGGDLLEKSTFLKITYFEQRILNF